MAEPRFLPLAEVAQILNIAMPQAYSLVHNKDLLGIQVGRRRQWRVEVSELEAYIQRCYAENEARPVQPEADVEAGVADEAELDR